MIVSLVEMVATVEGDVAVPFIVLKDKSMCCFFVGNHILPILQEKLLIMVNQRIQT